MTPIVAGTPVETIQTQAPDAVGPRYVDSTGQLAGGSVVGVWADRPLLPWIISARIAYTQASYSLSFQDYQLQTQMAAPSARKQNYTDKANYLQLDAGFKERRRAVAHNKLTQKLAAIIKPFGALNYQDRLAPIEQRAAMDLSEAFDRMTVVHDGLPIIYGIVAPPLPSPQRSFSDSDSESKETINGNLLNDAVLWLRKTAQQVQDIQAMDQPFFINVELKNSFFQRFKSENKFFLEFEISEKLFSGLKLVRMRGVSIESEHDQPNLTIVLTPPEVAVYITDGEAGLSRVKNSQRIPDCWVSDIRARRSGLPENIAGFKTLANASPIGTWKVKLGPTQDIEGEINVRVKMHLVVQVA